MEIGYWSKFPYSGNPVFDRGGNYANTTNAGLFFFGNPSGEAKTNSFRPVLATLWYNKFSYLSKQFFKENRIGGIKEVSFH